MPCEVFEDVRNALTAQQFLEFITKTARTLVVCLVSRF